jgi:hypothetical protein
MKPSIRVALAVWLGACGLAHAADLSRWHEVRGGGWQLAPAQVEAIRAQLQAAADASVQAKGGTRRAPPLEGGVPYASGVMPGPSGKIPTPIAGPDLSAYFIQYRGKAQGDRRLVEVHGACTLHGPAQRLDDEWLIVKDGGDCYFSAEYDLQAGRFLGFHFNGDA